MSRTNHYRICGKCTEEQLCWIHDGEMPHKPERLIEGRRPWRRKSRFPSYSIKSFIEPPGRWWWQEAHAKARRKLDELLRKDPEGSFPRERDLINLWDWY